MKNHSQRGEDILSRMILKSEDLSLNILPADTRLTVLVKLYKIILFLVLLTLGISEKIYLIDAISGKPIAHANFFIKESNLNKLSNNNGNVELSEKHTVQIIKKGYFPKIISYPYPKQIKLYPIVFRYNDIDVYDSITNPYFELEHPLNINKLKVNTYSSHNIVNIFNELPAMIVKSYGGMGGVKTLSLNGGQGDRIQVLFNGISINNEQSGNADISQIPIGLLDRIQFLPIGSSSRFGNSAMSGIINISSGFKPEFHFVSGYFNGGYNLNYSNSIINIKTQYGLNTGILNASQKINWTETGTYNPVLNTHKSYNWFISGLNQKYFSPWINFKHNNYQISSSALFTNNQRIHSGKVYGPSYFPKINDGIDLLGISFKKKNLKLEFSFKNQWINYKSNSPYTPPINTKHNLKVFKLDNEFLINSLSFFNRNILTKSSSNNTNPKDTSSIQIHFGFTFRNINNIINLYFTTRTIFEKKEAQIHSYEIILNRYFGSLFHFSTTYSKNYKKPNFNDLYWKPFGNENLKTEYSDNFYINSEIGFKELKLNFNSHYIIYKNMIIWLPKPGNQEYWSPSNIESTISKGHVAILSLKGFKNINSNISISKNTIINLITNHQNAYNPEWIFNWNTTYKFHNLNFRYSYNYQSYRYINYTEYDGKSLRKIPAYSTLNTLINYNFKLFNYQNSVAFLINNLMDTKFQSVYGYPELGRSLELQLTIKKGKK